jgi:hypothetical protein
MPPFQSSRRRCRFVSTRVGTAALIGLAVAVIAPAAAVALDYPPSQQRQYGMGGGTQPAKVSIENNVVTITNPADNGQSISAWSLLLNDILVDDVPHAPLGRLSCYESDPPSPDNPPSWGTTVGCDEGGKRLGAQQTFIPAIGPGETARWPIPGLDFDLNTDDWVNRFMIVWIDNECAQAQGIRAPLAVAFAAALDECDRERLGTPRVMASRVNASKIVLMISGAPAGWATRLFGASSPRKLKTAGSGTTLSTIAPSPGGYPRLGNGTVKAGPAIKFVREAWTQAGERPIFSPVVRVTK